MRCPTLSELPPPPPGKTGWPLDVAQDWPFGCALFDGVHPEQGRGAQGKPGDEEGGDLS
jgi:hypothetical protein